MRLSLLITLFVALFSLIDPAVAGAKATSISAKKNEQKQVFNPGERLVFNLRWGAFSVGEAVLTVHPDTKIKGEPVHHFSMEVRTNAFADRFYQVRDRVDGYLSKDLKRSVLYRKVQEGQHKRDIEVTFDYKAKEATYTNFGSSDDPIGIPTSVFDPLTVFYVFRTLPLTEGAEIELPVTDGRRMVDGVGRVHSTEVLTVPAGRFETILAEPDMKDVRGVFDQSDDATLRIWLSNDAHRIPVRLSSRVVVGSFHAELIAYEGVRVKEREPYPVPPKVRRQRR